MDGNVPRRGNLKDCPEVLAKPPDPEETGGFVSGVRMILLYSTSVFLSAFLLFLVQPVISKEILPLFGGSAAVWTTCLVFFQTTLLAGYIYADFCVRRLEPRRLVILHTALLVASMAVLPIVPSAYWKPNGLENPSWQILGLLAVSIGLPFFLLSTTSPLVQAWYSRANPQGNPYRLFALSNLASMLALVGYPFLLEPWAPTHIQALGWSAGYGLFVCLCSVTAWVSLARIKRRVTDFARDWNDHVPKPMGASGRPTIARQLLWCTLAAAGSILLLAVTTQIMRNVAAIPLLWIAPLAVYLLTFILAFESTGWYRRSIMVPLAGVGSVLMVLPLHMLGFSANISWEVGVLIVGLFLACMFTHGELALARPEHRFLTRFYLMVSLGGAAGSALVGLAAPIFLPAYFEFPIAMVLTTALIWWQVRSQAGIFRAMALVPILVTVIMATSVVTTDFAYAVTMTRNFYGALRVVKFTDGTNGPCQILINGTTVHGMQFLSSALKARATTYYSSTSGVGRLLTVLDRRESALRVGVIGLGTGTLAAYGRNGDTFRFYEIDPASIRIANSDFTFLKDSQARIEIAQGDARLNLENEAPQQFDVLVIDAFSSDAIPMHLLTFEAISLYRKHLRNGGFIALHVSNRFLDLGSEVAALALAHKLRAVPIQDARHDGLRVVPSEWVLLTDEQTDIDGLEVGQSAKPIEGPRIVSLWTDNFNNLFQVLR
jgi:hypothetical protein